MCVEVAEDTVTPNSPAVVGEVRPATEDDCFGCPVACLTAAATTGSEVPESVTEGLMMTWLTATDDAVKGSLTTDAAAASAAVH